MCVPTTGVSRAQTATATATATATKDDRMDKNANGPLDPTCQQHAETDVDGSDTSTVDTDLYRLNDNDVVSGRGSGVAALEGNKKFRKLIARFKGMYAEAERTKKTTIADKVIEEVKKAGGNFLERDGNGNFVEMEYKKALEKTSQALRERPSQGGRSNGSPRNQARAGNTTICFPTNDGICTQPIVGSTVVYEYPSMASQAVFQQIHLGAVIANQQVDSSTGRYGSAQDTSFLGQRVFVPQSSLNHVTVERHPVPPVPQPGVPVRYTVQQFESRANETTALHHVTPSPAANFGPTYPTFVTQTMPPTGHIAVRDTEFVPTPVETRSAPGTSTSTDPAGFGSSPGEGVEGSERISFEMMDERRVLNQSVPDDRVSVTPEEQFEDPVNDPTSTSVILFYEFLSRGQF
eukprot:CAMPEP_0116826664 /NCGR_PEP_ID=MMETSP0418-20121206/2655_1 /TAXON_ID=1158023 /ORGANISM="Astrosyne radiata, Strain 13vi08-1A" /LENGTH=405 /DNA_ID=CAMNT_0004455325 /DNA_START=1065 /DNA_END=2282 /DNA_ORIENTATION=+